MSGDTFAKVLHAKPGDVVAGYTLLRKGVENGHFVWWIKEGGVISLNNLIGQADVAARPCRCEMVCRETRPGKRCACACHPSALRGQGKRSSATGKEPALSEPLPPPVPTGAVCATCGGDKWCWQCRNCGHLQRDTYDQGCDKCFSDNIIQCFTCPTCNGKSLNPQQCTGEPTKEGR